MRLRQLVKTYWLVSLSLLFSTGIYAQSAPERINGIYASLAGDHAGEIAAFVEARVVDADVLRRLVPGRMLEVDVRKLLRDLDRRIHVAERSREDQLMPRLGELADHALGVGTFRHALDELRRHLPREVLFRREARDVVLVDHAEAVPAEQKDSRNPLYLGTTLIYPNLGTPITRSKRGSLVFFYTARAGKRALTGRVELVQDGHVLATRAMPVPPLAETSS